MITEGCFQNRRRETEARWEGRRQEARLCAAVRYELAAALGTPGPKEEEAETGGPNSPSEASWQRQYSPSAHRAG